MKRRTKVFLVFLAIVAIGLGTFTLHFGWSLVHPQYRLVTTADISWKTHESFEDAWDDHSKKFYGTFTLYPPPAFSPRALCEAEGIYLAVASDPEKVVTVLVSSGKPPMWLGFGPGAFTVPVPAMRVELETLQEVSSRHLGRTAVLPSPGDPPVVCDLTAAQAAYVRQNGVPSSLVEALVGAADAAGWRPLAPGIGPTRAAIVLPAAPHFPAAPAATQRVDDK